MQAKRKKTEQNLEAWLLSLERQMGMPVVVSFVVQDSRVEFLACVNKGQYMNSETEGDEGSGKPLPKTKVQGVQESKVRPYYMG